MQNGQAHGCVYILLALTMIMGLAILAGVMAAVAVRVFEALA